MSELIKITEQDGKRAVSARELHIFLESKSNFTDWIKYRISQYGFIENIDYQILSEISDKIERGRPTVDYALTIDMSKEIAMVEGNDKGKQARQYFIQKENEYRALVQTGGFQIPKTYAEALRLAADTTEKLEEANKQLLLQAPKVLFADSVSTSDKSVLVAELAKILNQNGIDIGQNRLYVWLRENGYLCSRGEYYNQPTQKAMDMGLFEIKKSTISQPNGTVLATTTTKVTGKGQIYFVNKFLKKAA